jgi:ribokinase
MVIVYGTICLDRISPIERLPASGEYVELGKETIALGGEAANTAMLLRAFGADVTLVGFRRRAPEASARIIWPR